MAEIKLLDLYCGAGGAGMGYHRAGFEVTGVDNQPQPHYPFSFIQADALEYLADHGHKYDVIHASPPCQYYSLGTTRWPGREYPNMLYSVEQALTAQDKPFVIENVERAPFGMPTITLCGTQFGLRVIRHRRFESNMQLYSLPHVIKHPTRGNFVTCAGHGGNGSNKFSEWCFAMNIYWMNKYELSQAIPPAYTEWIGNQICKQLTEMTDG